jgi:hypothetical protein
MGGVIATAQLLGNQFLGKAGQQQVQHLSVWRAI